MSIYGLKQFKIGWQKSVTMEFHFQPGVDAFDAVLIDACLTMLYGPAYTEQEIRHIPKALRPKMMQGEMERIMFEYDPVRFPRLTLPRTNAEN